MTLYKILKIIQNKTCISIHLMHILARFTLEYPLELNQIEIISNINQSRFS